VARKSKARVKYERRTTKLIESFKARQISFEECLSELDTAFERLLVPNIDQLPALSALVLDNNNAVMQEMAMRPIHLMPQETSEALAATQRYGATQACLKLRAIRRSASLTA
jgi:hypothetical protein